jgi:hypothetical protein
MKRRQRMNVNGKVPAGSKTWADLTPDERRAAEAKLEAVTGLDWMTVCDRLDQEMHAMERQEREAAAARKGDRR